jgi:type III secretory pathway component EscS
MLTYILGFIVSTSYLIFSLNLVHSNEEMHITLYVYLPILYLSAVPAYLGSLLGLNISLFKDIKKSDDTNIYHFLTLILIITSMWYIYTIW